MIVVYQNKGEYGNDNSIYILGFTTELNINCPLIQ